jgi:hypothetical protein
MAVKRKESTTLKSVLAICGAAYNDADMDENGFIKLLEREVEKAGNQEKAAEILGISAQYLSDLLKARRGPGKELLERFNLTRKIVYVKSQA